MRILVVSRISIPAKDRTLPAWKHLRSLGHEVIVEHPDSVPTIKHVDAIISMGVTVMDETFVALARFPGVPLFPFNWDCYAWVWEECRACGGEGRWLEKPDHPVCPACQGSGRSHVQAQHPSRGGEYNYVKYGDLLQRAAVWGEVWVPSDCTGRRTTQWWGIEPAKIQTILSACPWWDYPERECKTCYGTGELGYSGGAVLASCDVCRGSGKLPGVRDDDYALCTLRHIPDPWDTMFERACEEIKIPYRRTDHELSYEEYQDVVAGCRFMVSHYYEASTGGLTLLEAYRLGKPCLISDSEWHGGRDYFGHRAEYFRWGDFNDFCFNLRRMWACYRPVEPDHKEWIEEEFSDVRMVDQMMERIVAVRSKG